jgi:hypothetical protein
VFDSHGIERLTEWRRIRDEIEKDKDPLSIVSKIWSQAPFVNQYLDHTDPESWPDPWHLVLDSKFDNLAIVLGMLYTLQLTERFSREDYKIYMTQNDSRNPEFCLSISDRYVLNLRYGEISNVESLKNIQPSMIYQRSCR